MNNEALHAFSSLNPLWMSSRSAPMPLSADAEEAHPPPYKILSSPLLSPPSHHLLLLEPSTRVAALATTAGAAAASLTNYATTHRIHVYAHLGSPLHDAHNNPTPPRHPTTIATVKNKTQDCSLHHLHHDRDGECSENGSLRSTLTHSSQQNTGFEGPDGPPIATLKCVATRQPIRDGAHITPRRRLPGSGYRLSRRARPSGRVLESTLGADPPWSPEHPPPSGSPRVQRRRGKPAPELGRG
ncbi:hypothetical protein C8Q79DRAFT_13271 [Trametes meyenii]|nr:hypothetical protein C8Q79DRAFT_13271 [Trametes meyenii]